MPFLFLVLPLVLGMAVEEFEGYSKQHLCVIAPNLHLRSSAWLCQETQICGWKHVIVFSAVYINWAIAKCNMFWSCSPACRRHLLSTLKMCRRTSRFEITRCCLRVTFQAGINLRQDKAAWIKSSWGAIESSREHQTFADVPLGRFMSNRSKALGGSVITAYHPVKLISSSHASQPRSANLPGLKLFWGKRQTYVEER